MRPFSVSGIGVRFLVALGLVSATWNPSPYNYLAWSYTRGAEQTPVVVFVGLLLLIVWVVFLRATVRSLGPVGLALAASLAGSVLWLVLDYGLVDPADQAILAWVVLLLLAAILAAGMSWSHLRRRWAGQADVDDLDT